MYILDTNSEDLRMETAMDFVTKMNLFSCQKAGGFKAAPTVPAVIGGSCLICVTRGTCLGKTCLGDNGKFLFNLHTILYLLIF